MIRRIHIHLEIDDPRGELTPRDLRAIADAARQSAAQRSLFEDEAA
jgi:hypothetical protein